MIRLDLRGCDDGSAILHMSTDGEDDCSYTKFKVRTIKDGEYLLLEILGLIEVLEKLQEA